MTDDEIFATVRTALDEDTATRIASFLSGASFRVRIAKNPYAPKHGWRPWLVTVPNDDLEAAIRTCRIGGV